MEGVVRARDAIAALLFAAGAAALAPALPGGAARAEDAASVEEITPGAEVAIANGLERLAAMQAPLTGNVGERYKVASTSLAGLAFLASGDGYDRGRYGRAISGCVRYLLSDTVKVRVRGRPRQWFFKDDSDQGRMHAHGFATLFLAEIYGQTPRDDEIRDALAGAVEASLEAQTRLGGWGYHLLGEPEFGEDEASVTITQIQALRAARNAGIYVPADAVARALGYVRASLAADGSCRYSLTMRGAESKRTSFELTAAAVSTLNASGIYLGAGGSHEQELERSLAFLRRRMREYESPARAATDFYFYGNLYAAQAMFQAAQDDWEYWFPRVRQELLQRQRSDGHWESPRNFGDAYATASALLILELPRRYLPIFQK
jgi:hypothetical protein